AAADAGFRVTVFVMPIMPWLTDSDSQLDDALARIADAGAARVVFGALHLRPGAKEWFLEWIDREHPELATGYRRFYGSASYAPASYRRNLARRVRPLLTRHGLAAQEDAAQPEQRRRAASRAAHEPAAAPALALAPQPAVCRARARGSAGSCEWEADGALARRGRGRCRGGGGARGPGARSAVRAALGGRGRSLPPGRSMVGPTNEKRSAADES